MTPFNNIIKISLSVVLFASSHLFAAAVDEQKEGDTQSMFVPVFATSLEGISSMVPDSMKKGDTLKCGGLAKWSLSDLSNFVSLIDEKNIKSIALGDDASSCNIDFDNFRNDQLDSLFDGLATTTNLEDIIIRDLGVNTGVVSILAHIEKINNLKECKIRFEHFTNSPHRKAMANMPLQRMPDEAFFNSKRNC